MSVYQIAYIACDEDLSITENSTYATELLQLPERDIQGARLIDVCLPLIGSESQIAAVLDGTLPHLALDQISLETSDRSTRYISLVVLPHAVMLPHKPGLIIIIHDVTEQSMQQQRLQQQHGELLLLHEKVAEQNQQLASLNRKLNELSQLRSDLLSILGQDMQSSLQAIRQNSTLLLETERGALSNQQRQHIEETHRQVTHLLKLIENLIALQRLDSSDNHYRHFINLNQLVQQVVRSLNDQTHQTAMHIHYVPLPDTSIEKELIIVGDSALLQQAIANLFNYSMKYAGVERTLRVHLAMLTTPPALDPPLDPLRTWCALEIMGNGTNTVPRAVKRLFHPLSHITDVQTTHQTGDSFSLIVVQKIVQQHEGRVTIQSASDTGTTFTLLLPCVLQS